MNRKLLVFLSVFLIGIVFSTLIHPAFATTIFSDGFESGGFGAWNGTYVSGTTISVQSTTKHHGTYGMQLAGLGAVGERGWARKLIVGSILYARNYYNFGSVLPTASGSWWCCSPFFAKNDEVEHVAVPIYDFANHKWGIRFKLTSGTWTNAWETGTSSVSANTWYCIELYISTGSSGTVTLWIDGVQKVNATGLDIQHTIYFVEVGNPWVEVAESSDRTIYIDCVVVADTYIGPETTAQEISVSLTETMNLTAAFNQWQEQTCIYTETLTFSDLFWHGIETQSVIVETITPTETMYYWQELSFTNIENIMPTSILKSWQEQFCHITETIVPSESIAYGLEGIQEFTETIMETLSPTSILNYWLELAYSTGDTFTFAGQSWHGTEAYMLIIETITSSETIRQWQELSITNTETLTPTTILSSAAEGILQFIEFIEPFNLSDVVGYVIEQVVIKPPIDYGIIALGLAVAAFCLATIIYLRR